MEKINFDSPITKIITNTYVSFRVTKVDVNLNNSATVSVIVYNENNEFENFIEVIDINNNDYQEWGTDDNYIKEYVKNYLQTKYLA